MEKPDEITVATDYEELESITVEVGDLAELEEAIREYEAGPPTDPDEMELDEELLTLKPFSFVSTLRAANPVCIFVEEIEAKELSMLDKFSGEHPREGAYFKSMTQKHHFAAQLFASGRKSLEVARTTGYTMSTISKLKSSPAFVDLIHHYTEELKERTFDLHDKLALLGEVSVDQLLQKVEAGTLPAGELRMLAQGILDRIGYPSVSKVKTETTNVTDETLRSIRDEVKRATSGQVIDATPLRKQSSENRELVSGGTSTAKALAPPTSEVKEG